MCFLNNTVIESGFGGACFFKIVKLDTRPTVKTSLQIIECNFENNRAVQRGSIFQTFLSPVSTVMFLINTTFVSDNPLASDFVFLTTHSHLKNVKFFSAVQNGALTQTGMTLAAGGPYFLDDVLFSCHHSDISLFMNDIRVATPEEMQNLRNGSSSELTSLSVGCSACGAEPFPAGSSHAFFKMPLSESSSALTLEMSLHDVQMKSSCQACPFGGVCSDGKVTALPNYWGHTMGDNIIFLSYPASYCCNGIDACVMPTTSVSLTGQVSCVENVKRDFQHH